MATEFYLFVRKDRKYVVIACYAEKDPLDHTIQVISLCCDEDISAVFNAVPASYLILKLSTDKEYILKLKSLDDPEEIALNKLKNEFGKDYKIASYTDLWKRPWYAKLFPWFYKPFIANVPDWGGAAVERLNDVLYDKEEEYTYSDETEPHVEVIQEYRRSRYLFAAPEEEPPRRTVYQKVFYATDRNKQVSPNFNEYFGCERDTANGLHYGTCIVSIPKSHKPGNIESPGLLRRLFFRNPEHPDYHICIRNLAEKSESGLISDMTQFLKSTSSSDALIFIHGYNVSFHESVKRTAQIALDINFKGTAIAYSWPSAGTLDGYFADEDSVRSTVPHLVGFLKKVHSREGIQRIHVLAHSMGNRAITEALEKLAAEQWPLEKIGQVILAAPDIDANNFKNIIAPVLASFRRQITLYASSKDKALRASRKLRKNLVQRAGESGEQIVVVAGIDTVDASKVDTGFLGHGYFAETEPLLNDIDIVINQNFTPPFRSLESVPFPPDRYWQFRERMDLSSLPRF